MLTKLISLVLSALLLLGIGTGAAVQPQQDAWNTNYDFVFVHGLSGWGSYDLANVFVRYWGMFTGDIFGMLEKEGFRCHAASVDPTGSAWDRACELYAQLTGTVVDYGAAHSARCNHDRFGKDYGCRPLLENWDAEVKINLIGHSFGGATVRLLSELMAYGSEEERAATPEAELSGLFTGGKADWIYSITTLSAPHNGTTAYAVTHEGKDIVGPTNAGPSGLVRSLFSNLINLGTQPAPSTKTEEDRASHDMFIDNALALNERIHTLENVYYFSVTTLGTYEEDGVQVPDLKLVEEMFRGSGELIGRYTGETENGVVLDESWQPNDGLVNVISGRAPFNAPQQAYDPGNVEPGVWNILPEFPGDHTTFMGGLMVRRPAIMDFYLEQLDRINRL